MKLTQEYRDTVVIAFGRTPWALGYVGALAALEALAWLAVVLNHVLR
jgi:hypothetical protein